MQREEGGCFGRRFESTEWWVAHRRPAHGEGKHATGAQGGHNTFLISEKVKRGCKISTTELRLESQFRLARWVRQINSKAVGEEGDATLWSHHPLSVLPDVYRLRASVRLGHIYLVG